MLNIGYEVETGGHVFTINLTNTQALMENDFLPYTSANWAKGQVPIRIYDLRIFQFGDKNINPWTGKAPERKKAKNLNNLP
jgi:2',3'-cyclic-nucleotide 2'-phosphodiesterase (5'-nucleotidase family)